eukprot:2968511-Karenia_brevis.AAC.1
MTTTGGVESSELAAVIKERMTTWANPMGAEVRVAVSPLPLSPIATVLKGKGKGKGGGRGRGGRSPS